MAQLVPCSGYSSSPVSASLLSPSLDSQVPSPSLAWPSASYWSESRSPALYQVPIAPIEIRQNPTPSSPWACVADRFRVFVHLNVLCHQPEQKVDCQCVRHQVFYWQRSEKKETLKISEAWGKKYEKSNKDIPGFTDRVVAELLQVFLTWTDQYGCIPLCYTCIRCSMLVTPFAINVRLDGLHVSAVISIPECEAPFSGGRCFHWPDCLWNSPSGLLRIFSRQKEISLKRQRPAASLANSDRFFSSSARPTRRPSLLARRVRCRRRRHRNYSKPTSKP